ncbi:MAG: gfo/Idh/MocA family oxidoreductase [Planctomycetes bacterium]|nr:gfo/Idh/MocA family oxidoreductase [Planctomycetota bacterium]
MQRLNRRQFVVGSLAAAGAMTLPITRVRGANDKIGIAIIGLGGKGSQHLEQFAGLADARVVAICDPDSKVLGGKVEAFEKKHGYKLASETDLRKIMDRKDVDAVVVATPNHWHVLAGLWACQAGKDAYVEKPISHNIHEGRKLVEAARKYKRIVQGGTQQRSDPALANVKKFIAEGHLGKMQYIRANRYGVRGSIGKVTGPTPIPDYIDYDLWCGPAEKLPLMRKNLHYDWHWVWNTGSGEMGNWGVHILDDVRNFLDDQSLLPKRIIAGGGRFAWNDDGETPNTHFVYYDTGIVPVVFDLHNLSMKAGSSAANAYRNIRDGVIIQCEGGYYAGGRGGGAAFDNDGKRIEKFNGDSGRGHAQNFLDAVKSRDHKSLKAEIEITHYSSAWCHLANICYRVGHAYKKDEAIDAVKGLKPWDEVIDGFHEHLAAQNVDAATADIKLSAMLELDATKETFTGPTATPETLALLRRDYRAPFVVPEEV